MTLCVGLDLAYELTTTTTCEVDHQAIRNLLHNDIQSPTATPQQTLLLTLEVVQQHTSLLALLTPVLDNDARAVDNLACIALAVQDTQTGPLAQLLAVGHLDEGDLVLGAQRDDQLLVRFFFTGLVEHAHVCLAAVEGFGRLAEAAGEAIVDESDFEDTFDANVLAVKFFEGTLKATTRVYWWTMKVRVLFVVDGRTFEGIKHTHRATRGSSLITGNLNFIGGGNGGCWLFSVRLWHKHVSYGSTSCTMGTLLFWDRSRQVLDE